MKFCIHPFYDLKSIFLFFTRKGDMSRGGLWGAAFGHSLDEQLGEGGHVIQG